MKKIHGLALAGGLVVATLGGAGLVLGASEGEQSAFVPVVPCRLLDTRPAPDNVGPIGSALGDDSTTEVTVWGETGDCVTPATATAVALNVTAINGTAPSFLTLFPADAAARPTASNLNWLPGQAPTPNKVDVKLSADGTLNLYNLAGSVDVIADVVGYYEPVEGGGGPGPQGPIGPAGPTGPSGPAGTGLGDITIVTETITLLPTTSNGEAVADCPVGQVAIGGGVDGNPSDADFVQGLNVRADRPNPENAITDATGWFGDVRVGNVPAGETWIATVYALCVTP